MEWFYGPNTGSQLQPESVVRRQLALRTARASATLRHLLTLLQHLAREHGNAILLAQGDGVELLHVSS